MANVVSLELYIKTELSGADTSQYTITFEAINPVGIPKEIFVVRRLDNIQTTTSYSRVASLEDITNLGTSGITKDREYRVGKFSMTTASLTLLQELKDKIPTVVKNLLDETKAGRLSLVPSEETLVLVGEVL